jgi:hypothetical protein
MKADFVQFNHFICWLMRQSCFDSFSIGFAFQLPSWILDYLRCEKFDQPQIDYTEKCPEDFLGTGCILSTSIDFDFVVAIVNSDVNIDDCEYLSAEKFAVGTFHPTANDLQQFQSNSHNFKKAFQFQ